MPEFSDDPGIRTIVRLQCTECGWAGDVPAIVQYGAVSTNVEECPECGGDIVKDDWR